MTDLQTAECSGCMGALIVRDDDSGESGPCPDCRGGMIRDFPDLTGIASAPPIPVPDVVQRRILELQVAVLDSDINVDSDDP